VLVEAVEKVPEARVIGLFWVSFIRKLGVARGQIRWKTDLSYSLVISWWESTEGNKALINSSLRFLLLVSSAMYRC